MNAESRGMCSAGSGYRLVTAQWAGQYVAEVTNDRFEKCTCLGVLEENGAATNPYYDVGFRELDTDKYSGVNFIL